MNGMAHLPFDDLVMPGSPISPDNDSPATVDCWGAGIASTGFQDVWALAEAQEDVIPVQQQQQQQQTQPQSHHLGGMPAAAGAATPGGPLLPASVSAQAFCSSAQSGTANFVLSSPAGVPQMGSTAMPMAPSSLAMLDLQLPITMVSGPQASMQLQLQPQAQQPAYSSSGAACAAQHNMAVSQAAQRRQQQVPVRKQLMSAVFRVAHDLLVEDAIFSYGNKRPGICMADSRDSKGDTFNGLAAASAPALPPVRHARSCGTGDACWGKSMGPAAGATSAVSAPAPAPAAPFKSVGTAAGVAAFASENSSTGRQQRRFVAAVRRARPSQTVPNLQLWQQQQQQAVTGSLLPGALALEVPAVGPAWQQLQC